MSEFETAWAIDDVIAAKAKKNAESGSRKYTDDLRTDGPTMFKIVSVAPEMTPGGLAMGYKAVLEDASLPDSEQGKCLVERVPYGQEKMTNGKARDTFLVTLLQSTDAWPDERLNELKSMTREDVFESLVGQTIRVRIARNDRGYPTVKAYLKPWQYEADIKAGERTEAPPRPARKAAA